MLASLKNALGLLVAPVIALAAVPAAAQSTVASSASSVSEAPATTPLGEGDDTFRTLFSEWQSVDEPTAVRRVSEIRPAASIPSGMPVRGVTLTSSYGMRDHPVLKRRARHKGVDLAGTTGTPIYATADGVVSRADRFSSYGLYVSIEHGDDYQTRYAHMSGIAVSAGEYVRRGDVIGYIGSTGRSTGPHLHYEIRVAGRAINPVPYMIESESERLAVNDLGGVGGGEEDDSE